MLVLVVIWTIFTIANDRFLTAVNLTNLALQIAAVGTISVGVVLVLLLGEIDLSVGAVSGLAAAVIATLLGQAGLGRVPGDRRRLAVGAAIGLFQGTLSTRLGIPSFVVTLAGLLGWQGALLDVLGDDRHGQHHRPGDHRPRRHVLLRRRRLAGRGRVIAAIVLSTLGAPPAPARRRARGRARRGGRAARRRGRRRRSSRRWRSSTPTAACRWRW